MLWSVDVDTLSMLYYYMLADYSYYFNKNKFNPNFVKYALLKPQTRFL